MRTIIIAILMTILPGAYSAAATENNSFEKSFQSFGKKIDDAAAKAKAKGQELGRETKEELNEMKAKTEQAAEEAAAKTKKQRDTWGARITGAFSDLGEGMKNAWNRLKGERE